MATRSAARGLHRLTHIQVQRANARGMLHDGGGLYLSIAAGGSKSWIYRYRINGKSREMGLGGAQAVSLAEARALAADARAKATAGIDPINLRGATVNAQNEIPGFSAAARAYIEAHKPEWRNDKHASQWANTLAAYAEPTIGKMRIDRIGISNVLAVLSPIWSTKTETASRVRQRIEAIIDAQYVLHGIDRRNPARWKGGLDALLPTPTKVARLEHLPAMPYRELPEFMRNLRGRPSVSARCLEFTILTTSRTGMSTGALHSEIANRVWTVPKERMKGGREFEVPLSGAAQSIVDGLAAAGVDAIFPSYTDRPLSTGAMHNLLRYMHRSDVTVHGFRSSFRDWAGNETHFAREVIEEAMAHKIKDKAEAAYRRGVALVKRRKLMDAWAAYLGY